MNFDFTKEPGRELLHRGLSHDGAPFVSIITPFYNAGKYFEQTFNCVMNQTFPWFEWIIVNDGSTRAEDVRLLERFAEKDDRITVIHKENGGISTGRNAAIRASSTDIIIPLDADDLIAPTYVEVLYWALRKNPDCSWSYSCNVGFQNQEYLWDKPFDPERERTPKVYIVEKMQKRITVADTDEGKELAGRIEDLKELLKAYRSGLLKERVR